MKEKTLKIIIILVLIAGTFGGFLVYKNSKENALVSKNLGFQPEGTMVDQAQAVGQKGATETAEIKNIKGYTYDKTACDSGSYLCFADYYKKLTAAFGSKVAIADIKERAAENSGVLGNCHPLMHVIGRQAALSYDKVSSAFLAGDSYCWSGYYHGIMEGMILKMGKDRLLSDLNNICSDIPGKAKYSFDYFNCVHGIGHGVMALSGDEVLDSLKSCDILKGDWEQNSCYGGVFMQNIIDSTNVADTDNIVKYLKPNEPMYPCNIVGDKYKSQCYLGQSSYALQQTGYDFKKVFDMCQAVAEPYRDICNQSMGRDVANQSSHEPQLTKNRCDIPNETSATTNCIIGAVKEIISYYHSDTQAKVFCNTVDAEYRSMCSNVATSYYSYF